MHLHETPYRHSAGRFHKAKLVRGLEPRPSSSCCNLLGSLRPREKLHVLQAGETCSKHIPRQVSRELTSRKSKAKLKPSLRAGVSRAPLAAQGFGFTRHR